jgi:oxygen-dependent protoporphyrinogen oxidase
VISVAKTRPAAQNRYILHKDSLWRMPSTIKQYLLDFRNPVMRGTLPRFLKEPFVKKASKSDESIHDFVTRRLGTRMASELISAVVHGIYAGDTRKLSGILLPSNC